MLSFERGNDAEIPILQLSLLIFTISTCYNHAIDTTCNNFRLLNIATHHLATLYIHTSCNTTLTNSVIAVTNDKHCSLLYTVL